MGYWNQYVWERESPGVTMLTMYYKAGGISRTGFTQSSNAIEKGDIVLCSSSNRMCLLKKLLLKLVLFLVK